MELGRKTVDVGLKEYVGFHVSDCGLGSGWLVLSVCALFK